MGLAAVVGASLLVPAVLPAPTAAQLQALNIVVVLSDDQPYWAVDSMPWVSSAPGLEPFGTLYDNYAFCCPARATFLTGLYSNHTGVERNDGTSFDDSSTLATWLDDGGYETGLFGKYLNKYPFDQPREYVPPGWDRWAALEAGESQSYYGYDLNVDGELKSFGTKPGDYSTEVISDLAQAFVETAPQPFFAFVTPHGPHAPFLPAPQDRGASAAPPWPPVPNFNRRARRAPAFYRRLPRADRAEQRANARAQRDALLSIDRMTRRLVDAADDRGPTIVLYLSDNGLSMGSHRFVRKRCGYEECGRVPALIRAPGDPSQLLASNADLAPTLADLAGVQSPPTDGESLVDDMLAGAQPPEKAILLRNKGAGEVPGFWGVRTAHWKYLEHAPRAGRPRTELYDLDADPYELRNLHGRDEYAADEAALAARLDVLRETPPTP